MGRLPCGIKAIRFTSFDAEQIQPPDSIEVKRRGQATNGYRQLGGPGLGVGVDGYSSCEIAMQKRFLPSHYIEVKPIPIGTYFEFPVVLGLIAARSYEYFSHIAQPKFIAPAVGALIDINISVATMESNENVVI